MNEKNAIKFTLFIIIGYIAFTAIKVDFTTKYEYIDFNNNKGLSSKCYRSHGSLECETTNGIEVVKSYKIYHN